MRRTARGLALVGMASVVGAAAVALAAPSITEISGSATVGALAQRVMPPPASGASPSLGGCSVFPPDNPWNTRVDTLPLRQGSAQTIARLGGSLHPDFGENPEYGIPFIVVPADQAPVPITFRDNGAEESEPGPYPIPPNAPVEGGSDGHVLVLQQGSCRLFELDEGARSGAGWVANWGAVFDLSSNDLRPLGWTSADAAGLPILPGLVRYEEVAAGRISHAIRITFSQTQRAYIFPATHFASSRTDPVLPPMGLRLRLRGDFDISGLSSQARVIATAMKEYGVIVADNGSNWFFQGAPSAGWNDDDLGELKDIPGTAFEVVYTGDTHS
jgi:hypothetical protein